MRGYFNGVAANGGNWNPVKWDWQRTWSAVLGGAIGGAAISGALGTISSNPGAIKFVLPGIISGGLNSAFTGSNFLGGIIGGISYSGNLFTNNVTSTSVYSELAKAEYDALGIPDSGEALDPSIQTLRKMFKDTGWSEMNTGAKQFYVDHVSSPYIKKGDAYYNTITGEDVYAYTRSNPWDNNSSSISFSKASFASKIKLGFVMTHELGHSRLNTFSTLFNLRYDKTTSGYVPSTIPGTGSPGVSIDHAAIWGLERDFLQKNGLSELPKYFNNSSKMNIIFNQNILNSVTYKQFYEKIKILSVKIK
ncbi:hypothetical protein LF887_08620 [Chryseobacterium sp. MEBOG06]|uniref:hypothetical protein n=1 Tax=Chryseobacterium sp. MEBOG06 TaxID=2879938 RepID=UPI001F1A8A13|nr:hypothetical protein [Chryseobacterium sp. MEBOG06]UKB85670.1 hypothetical protein LF887_08620 [Chryseobacterium sp. MEBOG06]